MENRCSPRTEAVMSKHKNSSKGGTVVYNMYTHNHWPETVITKHKNSGNGGTVVYNMTLARNCNHETQELWQQRNSGVQYDPGQKL
ncbi:hypothetical protein ACOMHN_065751 [Nucella lapillus]